MAIRGAAPEDVTGARAAAWAVFLILLGVFTATMCGLPDNTDSECEFQTTSALARTGRLALGGTPEGDAMAANVGLAPVRVGTDGRAYSWFGIGQAGLAVPLYLAGRALGQLAPSIEERHARTIYYGYPRSEYFEHLLVGWRNPLLSALTAWLLVLVVRELGASARASFFCGVSYGLASYAWAQARSTLSDVQATFFVFAAFALLLLLRRRQMLGLGRSRSALLGFGAALGLAFLTRSLTAPALVVLGLGAVAVGARARRARGLRAVLGDAAWAAVPAAACLAIFLWTNVARFGDPLESGYGEPLSTGLFFSHPLHLGFAGLLLSPGKGLFWTAPLVLLAPFGVRAAWRRGRRLYPLLLAGVLAAVFVPVAKMAGWHGAWTYGPRYVLPALPFLWAAAWLAYDRAGARMRVAFLALTAIGVITSLPAALVDHQTHQELAMSAARLERDPTDELDPALPPAVRDEQLFQQIQWDWRFAAPWAHWRILRHRVSGGEERFSAAELFFLDRDAPLTVSHDRQRGFLHLAWVDLSERLDGPGWVGWAISLALVLAGTLVTLDRRVTGLK